MEGLAQYKPQGYFLICLPLVKLNLALLKFPLAKILISAKDTFAIRKHQAVVFKSKDKQLKKFLFNHKID